MITGKEFIEKMYSQNEEVEERLFSTGSDELDSILEEVYYSGIEDGYDYAQREFTENEKEDKKSHKGLKAAGIAAGATVATVGALELANAIKKKSLTPADKRRLKRLIDDKKQELSKEGKKITKEEVKKLTKKVYNERRPGQGIGFVEKGNKAVKGAYNTLKIDAENLGNKIKNKINEKKEAVRDARKTKQWNKQEEAFYNDLAKNVK